MRHYIDAEEFLKNCPSKPALSSDAEMRINKKIEETAREAEYAEAKAFQEAAKVILNC